ncbi:MAG: hypothetical protein OCD76_12620 [Reichenbachiella sp.]
MNLTKNLTLTLLIAFVFSIPVCHSQNVTISDFGSLKIATSSYITTEKGKIANTAFAVGEGYLAFIKFSDSNSDFYSLKIKFESPIKFNPTKGDIILLTLGNDDIIEALLKSNYSPESTNPKLYELSIDIKKEGFNLLADHGVSKIKYSNSGFKVEWLATAEQMIPLIQAVYQTDLR